jgi:pyridoxine kinase
VTAADRSGAAGGPAILSVQSWVAYGHVGNAGVAFPLQRLGAEPWVVNTVQFSNHPGYGAFRGAALPAAEIGAVLEGIAALGVLVRCAALLSGYLGEAATGPAVLAGVAALRRANPAALYACDPVMGDIGPGIYVDPGIPPFMRAAAVPAADILTPNAFELGLLSGMPVATLDQAAAAALALRAAMRPAGPRTVLVTSVPLPDAVGLLVADAAGLFLLPTPRLDLAVHGAGDLVAALFMLHRLRGRAAAAAMAEAGSAVWNVIRHTAEAGARELLLVAAQAELVRPSRRFQPVALAAPPG